jgi:Ulp1 family protease
LNAFFVRIICRWSRRLDLSTYDNIFLPINVNNVHWCMAVIRPKAKQLLYLDSLNGESPYCLKLLERFLNDEGKARGIKALTGVWEKIQVPDAPLTVLIARHDLDPLGRKSSSNGWIQV